ncbi:MAG: ketopantoate reductase family protein [Candidatus Sifarchaeia archaeon]
MKIVVVGSGAIGSLYGAFLSRLEETEVILIGRNPHVSAIQSKGLLIKGVLGEHFFKLKAMKHASEVDKADLVIITTKTYDTLIAAKSAKHLIDGGASILLIQNGLGTEELVAKALDTTKVLRATTCMGALRTSPGVVTATGYGLTEIGSRYPENYELVENLTAMLKQVGFDVRSSDNIEGVVWTKTLVNCGINPVGALTGLSNGEVYKNKALRSLIVRLVEEAVKVVKALGIELTTEDPVRYALGTAKATGNNINSMLQDLRAGKRTEIDAITGEIIRLAKQYGIETPSNEAVYALIKALESKYIEEGMKLTDMDILAVDDLVEAITR